MMAPTYLKWMLLYEDPNTRTVWLAKARSRLPNTRSELRRALSSRLPTTRSELPPADHAI
jgi:hypothetical protein